MGFIYFGYGMTKSASSFIYQLEERVFKLSNYDLVKIPHEIRGNKAAENYLGPITDDKIREVLDWLPKNAVTVIKTHGAPSQLACDLVEQGQAFASATYRDPRDIAVSMVDHGQRARAKGIADFANFHKPSDALSDIKHQLNRLNPWLNLSACQPLSYDLIRTSPEKVVQLILDQVGLKGVDISSVLEPFFQKNNIIHYNVGVSGRYHNFMSQEEVEKFNKELEAFIKFCHN